ncbi:MAG: sugar phosphate isomerase/epimerase [candidate division KSB1 bacterium]|nr:sugar phosphate isomerase/epimerase [candidate division KSB1 bacterium]
MIRNSRREFLTSLSIGALGAALSEVFVVNPLLASKRSASSGRLTERIKFTLGIASYTFRRFNLEQTLAMTRRLGIDHIAFKDFHLPLDSSEKQIKSVANAVQQAGLKLYGCGVVYMRNTAEVLRAFEYAKAAGMELIIGVPEHDLLGLVNEKVQQFDIKLAIHNHGPGDERYPSPESAYERIKSLDRRIGLCIDIGHTQRLGQDPAEAIRRFADRLLDVHIKDVSASNKEGTTVEIGRGVIDIPRVLRTLIQVNYSGVLAFEFEKDETDPLPGVAESVGFVRGVLATV